MTVQGLFEQLTGEWKGTNRLWLTPEKPARESEASAAVAIILNGQFAELDYTWFFDKAMQRGKIIFGGGEEPAAPEAVWFDTFHMENSVMHCRGEISPEGRILLNGHYPAPPGPDWGWATEIDAPGADEIILRMYNISPEGQRDPAVEMVLTRNASE